MSRKLFEQTVNNDPTLTKRIAFGGAGVITENITMSSFITWLQTKLGFLKTSNNLSDLADKPTARTNLGVYSSTEMDTALLAKGTLREAGSGSVLGINNSIAYQPTGNYNPATKLYADGFDMEATYSGATANFNVVYNFADYGLPQGMKTANWKGQVTLVDTNGVGYAPRIYLRSETQIGISLSFPAGQGLQGKLHIWIPAKYINN